MYFQKTLFDKLDPFIIPHSDEQNFFMNMVIFDFEQIFGQEDKFRDIDTTTWIGKHVPMSVSISSNLIEQPIFLSKSNPEALVESFIDALDGYATQSKAQMKLSFLDIETSVKSKLNQITSAPNQRGCRKEPILDFENECIEEEEQEVSIQFLKTQTNHDIKLQSHLERYCSFLPVFGSSSAKYDINSIKSYLLPLFVNERSFEPIVVK